MEHVTCNMKVAQTELTETEYRLLQEYAKKKKLTLKELLRQGAMRIALEDEIQRDDPVFTEAPVAKASGKRERTSVEHDKYLYGLSK
jgi:hypothetical protein